jgi:hypothetical protein
MFLNHVEELGKVDQRVPFQLESASTRKAVPSSSGKMYWNAEMPADSALLNSWLPPSPTNTHADGGTWSRSRATRKIRGSGLRIRSTQEKTVTSNNGAKSVSGQTRTVSSEVSLTSARRTPFLLNPSRGWSDDTPALMSERAYATRRAMARSTAARVTVPPSSRANRSTVSRKVPRFPRTRSSNVASQRLANLSGSTLSSRAIATRFGVLVT